MPQYLVKAPCTYVNPDGSVSHHREAGQVVDIPADVAAELGDAVQPLVSGAAPDRFAAVKVSVDGVDQGPGKRGKRPDDAKPGDAVEGDGDG